MKKTKVILFILLFALVIGVSTQVKADVEYDGGGFFVGNHSEFLQLSEEERSSITDLYLIENEDEYDDEFDYSILKNSKKLKVLGIYNDKNLTDINQLPTLENLESLEINPSIETELNNFKEIGNKFRKLDNLTISKGVKEIAFDDFKYVINKCESLNIFNSDKIIILADYGTVNKDENVRIDIPYQATCILVGKVYYRKCVESNNCTCIEKATTTTDYQIKLNTANLGEYEAIANFELLESYNESYTTAEIEIKIKYTVEEKEEPVVEEPKQEESKPDKEEEKPSTPEEKPITGTGEEEIKVGFLGKIIDTIKNIINSIIEKITNLFKFKY